MACTLQGGAGRARRVGVRPTVRGVAMNAVDHPQGGKGVGGDRNTDPRGKYVKGQRSVRGKRVKNKGLRREIVRGRRGEKK
jgi:large subunit ribosomal protein L2